MDLAAGISNMLRSSLQRALLQKLPETEPSEVGEWGVRATLELCWRPRGMLRQPWMCDGGKGMQRVSCSLVVSRLEIFVATHEGA